MNSKFLLTLPLLFIIVFFLDGILSADPFDTNVPHCYYQEYLQHKNAKLVKQIREEHDQEKKQKLTDLKSEYVELHDRIKREGLFGPNNSIILPLELDGIGPINYESQPETVKYISYMIARIQNEQAPVQRDLDTVQRQMDKLRNSNKEAVLKKLQSRIKSDETQLEQMQFKLDQAMEDMRDEMGQGRKKHDENKSWNENSQHEPTAADPSFDPYEPVAYYLEYLEYKSAKLAGQISGERDRKKRQKLVSLKQEYDNEINRRPSFIHSFKLPLELDGIGQIRYESQPEVVKHIGYMIARIRVRKDFVERDLAKEEGIWEKLRKGPQNAETAKELEECQQYIDANEAELARLEFAMAEAMEDMRAEMKQGRHTEQGGQPKQTPMGGAAANQQANNSGHNANNNANEQMAAIDIEHFMAQIRPTFTNPRVPDDLKRKMAKEIREGIGAQPGGAALVAQFEQFLREKGLHYK